jgi:hypothetical protein
MDTAAKTRRPTMSVNTTDDRWARNTYSIATHPNHAVTITANRYGEHIISAVELSTVCMRPVVIPVTPIATRYRRTHEPLSSAIVAS